MNNISKVIGGNIRKHRQIRGMTREQLAEALDLDTAYLGQCERGERQLGLSKTIEIIEYFGLTANDIIPINLKKEGANRAQYLEKINAALEGCTDNQLLAVLKVITAMIPFTGH